MKKLILILTTLFLMNIVTGCEVVTGEYKEGTYFGYSYDNEYDAYATAVVYIDQTGSIKSVFIDTTYINKEKSSSTVSTKRIEKDDYKMKVYYPSAVGEWYEQVEKVEKYVVENQGLDIELNSEGKTDAISGATINISPIKEAVNNALKQAK